MTEATPVVPAANGTVPGKTLGVVAVIVVFFVSLLGLILGIVARSQSKGAGVKNTPATVAIVLGIIFLVGQILFFVLGGAALFGGLAAACGQYGPGEHLLDNGTTLTCG